MPPLNRVTQLDQKQQLKEKKKWVDSGLHNNYLKSERTLAETESTDEMCRYLGHKVPATHNNELSAPTWHSLLLVTLRTKRFFCKFTSSIIIIIIIWIHWEKGSPLLLFSCCMVFLFFSVIHPPPTLILFFHLVFNKFVAICCRQHSQTDTYQIISDHIDCDQCQF